ncbi:carboxypeptidase regulatory-like domain-containing protein [Massilia putida]|uniref:carboxypeptidase regulatory-like domain-containing protein n=1 Tax=Massilia putida TaxID=1141883 RepID=UPI000951D8E2|nr:carboxypeptidase regulatory-like domain-containing protein [Massilia putida]
MMQAHDIASGIAGDVVLRPVSPIERPGSINQRPYQALIGVTNQAGQAVAEVRSGPDGRFEIILEPGTYVLHPQSEAIYPHAAPQTVTVVKDHVTPVHIVYDSGMR